MKNQAAGGGCKNESFFNNFFQYGRLQMSRHILLLNPTLIFKGLFLPIAYKITLIRAKYFGHTLSLLSREWSPSGLLPTAPARTANTRLSHQDGLSNKMLFLQFDDRHSKFFYSWHWVESCQFLTWHFIKSLIYYLVIKMQRLTGNKALT